MYQLAARMHEVRSVKIVDAVYQTISLLASKESYEICGGLFGYANAQMVFITNHLPCQNFSHSKARFVLDLRELDKPRTLNLPQGGGLVGIYHSHVNERPYLSLVDGYFLRIAPWIWMVLGHSENSITTEILCYKQIDGTVQPITYSVIN